MTALSTLQKYFGYSSFRPGQAEIVAAILSGRDTLSILPTGGGKSVCFQVPGLMMPGTTLVLSPLISLMEDQVAGLQRRGIPAACITSGQTAAEQATVLNELAESRLKFLYCSPERLNSRLFIKALTWAQIPLLVIDEAHCISQWGHEFRPSYRQIPSAYAHIFTRFSQNSQRSEQPAAIVRRPPIAALTATATPMVREDILASLQLDQPVCTTLSFQRTNLATTCVHTPRKNFQELLLLRLLKQHQGESGIIYVATRLMAEYLARLLGLYRTVDPTIPLAVAYHAGLAHTERARIQAEFLENAIPVIIATNAFGMGVDKPNVRFVIHVQIPGSIEAYYQEIGRAGRDGGQSTCYLLYNPGDLDIQAEFIKKSQSPTHRQALIQKLTQMLKLTSDKHCRTAQLLSYFGESAAAQSGCDCEFCRSLTHPRLTAHPTLQFLTDPIERSVLKRILNLRQDLSEQHQIAEQVIMTDLTACYLACLRPRTAAQALLLPGIGQGWVNAWWEMVQYTYHDHSKLN